MNCDEIWASYSNSTFYYIEMREMIPATLILLIQILVWSPLVHCDEDNWYPNYHIAPKKGWMNDPNGLSYHNGFYHVFWQYNPDAPQWGLMHWGHARSKDLLTWEYLPIALTPSLPEDINGIFSGSAVIKDDKLTLIYTGVSENSTRQRQLAAFSTNGIDFEKIGVIIDKDGDETDFRDPKVWFQDSSWFAVIGSKTPDNRGEVLLFQSADFTNWTFDRTLAQSDGKLGYMWECPDFFTLGNKQILVVNPQGIEQEGYDYQNLFQTGYFVGSWAPGTNYTIEKGFREIDHGHDFYAAQTFLAPDGRRILIGWMDMWESVFPESKNGWSCMLTLPRELTLSKSGDLEIRPIREIQKARVVRHVSSQDIIVGDTSVALDDGLISSEVRIDFNLENTTNDLFGVAFGPSDFSDPFEGVKIYVNRSASRLFLERNYPQYNIAVSSRSIAIDLTAPILSLDIFIDKSSIEVFVNDGQGVMSSRIYPNSDQRMLQIYGSGKKCHVSSYSIWDLVI